MNTRIKRPEKPEPETLREKAERKVKERLSDHNERETRDPEKLFQELQIHQIQLEMQNEELRQAQYQLEYTRQQYVDLYNEAPVGYASLDDSGLIVRANETLAGLLGVHQEFMLGRALVEFMETEDQVVFRSRFRAFASNPARKHIDVRFRNYKKQDSETSFAGRIYGRRISGETPGYENRFSWEETLLVVVSDVTELKRTEEQIRLQAFHDTLTGLPNRLNLYDRLETSLALARRHNRFGALLYMDMDRFKNVNDSLGHHVGDELLVSFADRLREHIRREDLLVRMGGDEFVVLLAEQDTDSEKVAFNAQRFAEHIFTSLTEPISVIDHLIPVSICVGISVYPFHPDDGVDDIIRQADTAMYQAKNDGRNLLRFYRAKMQERAKQRMTLETELRIAISERQFEVYYQPQVAPDGSIKAIEALLRWHHPKRGMVLPGELITATEETGLIMSLGDWVLETVTAQIKQWQSRKLCSQDIAVGINISPKQFQVGGFADKVEKILAYYDLAPSSLVLEITESMLIPDDTMFRVELERLARLGLTFAVDDFGTGYSSLSVLLKAPVGQLKIAQQFVHDLEVATTERSPGSHVALVKTIISMAKELNMKVVAEGVETEYQRGALELLGCDLMQGFLFSPAVPADQMTALLEKKPFTLTEQS